MPPQHWASLQAPTPPTTGCSQVFLELFVGYCWFAEIVACMFFPPWVGLLDFKLNSSPRPELFSSPSLLLAHPWSAQPQSLLGVANPRESLQCPTPESPCPRVSLECPTPEYLYQERVGMSRIFCVLGGEGRLGCFLCSFGVRLVVSGFCRAYFLSVGLGCRICA